MKSAKDGAKRKGKERSPKRPVSTMEACKMAYRKHAMGDDSIGWNELSDVLAAALANGMGDKRFVTWLDKVSPRMRPITE